MRTALRMGLAAPQLPLLAGGSGHVGRHLLAALAGAGCTRARVLDIRPPTSVPEGLEVDFRHHRLGSDSASPLRSALDGVDCVFNLVTADVQRATEAELRRTNVTGVSELLSGSRAASVAKFVHVSSVAVTDHSVPCINQSEEEALPLRSAYSSPYDAMQREAEDAVVAANAEGFATVALRPGTLVAGPGDIAMRPMLQIPGNVISLEDSALIDVMAATDFCRAMLAASDRLDSPAVAGQAIYVTKGVAIRPHEVAAMLAKELGWNLVLLPTIAQTCIGFGMQVRRGAESLLGGSVSCVTPKDFMRMALTEKTFNNSRAFYTLDFESLISIEEAIEQVVREHKAQQPKSA